VGELMDKANEIVRKAVEWDLSREGIQPDVMRYADVPGLFEPFTWCPQGGDFQTMATGMLPTLHKLSTSQTVAESRFIAAAVLKGCLEAEDAMWGEVSEKVEQIADHTLRALELGDASASASVIVDCMREEIGRLKHRIVHTETRIAKAASDMGHLVETAPVSGHTAG
jgi:hypothetical protein